jgi:hypothetical protein
MGCTATHFLPPRPRAFSIYREAETSSAAPLRFRMILIPRNQQNRLANRHNRPWRLTAAKVEARFTQTLHDVRELRALEFAGNSAFGDYRDELEVAG